MSPASSPTCSAATRSPAHDPLADYPNVDGVVALTHKTGCGMTQDEPLRLLRRTLAGYARHPNFSHVIVLGLGCEVNQIGGLMEEQRLAGRLRAMDIQTMGGSRKTVAAGVDFVKSVLAEANDVRRETVPASELTIALQCGGSDGYSGVSANPALGAASDLVVRHGGTVILSETPETYGAEHLLTRRAVSPEVGEKLVALMHWWEDYTKRENAEMNANPSPGNKAGGLTTILEKSLGAMAKAGTTNLVDVIQYAEEVKARGFVFMDTPGYDPVAATGQVAGGANLVCFTTGRGSVFGCKPAPSIKLATNTPMFRHIEDDMDVNCGTVLDGDETVQQAGAAHLRSDAARRLGRADQERAIRLRCRRVRPLGARRDDVSGLRAPGSSLPRPPPAGGSAAVGRGPGLAAQCRPSGGLADLLERVGMRQRLGDAVGDRLGGEEVDQQPVPFVLDHLLHRRCRRSDHEAAGRHRLQHRPGQHERHRQVDMRRRDLQQPQVIASPDPPQEMHASPIQ